ncbi:hypothetical protein [Streptomyces sp. NBC_00120]|uniref:hypothetical protein n=1 Tax=Streptomyces sp. NBC_00120 TaxID=2975660 RepID=UPI0022509115|nr:hypothetical protein [Streptomyces sp. NBC_00120]MCX5326275.1 hypothetical protein [Streptomyces sp. NBC_00120]
MGQSRTFTLNTTPHVATVGETELLFQPEVMGDEFLDAYESLQDSQQSLGVDVNNLAAADPENLRAVVRSLRLFLARLMLPESAQTFAQWEVVKNGQAVSTHATPDEAAQAASEVKGATTVKDAGMRLPDRVLVELLEWVVELYGGGQRPTGLSSGSVQASPPPGTRGRAVSPSKASTRARGR